MLGISLYNLLHLRGIDFIQTSTASQTCILIEPKTLQFMLQVYVMYLRRYGHKQFAAVLAADAYL